jgi:hypothetical protein
MRFLLCVAAFCSCATWTTTGSIYRSDCVHVGLRPVDLTYVDDESDGYGLSFRVSTEWGPCFRDSGTSER